MKKATLSSEITSYDLLKTFAVIFMIIDHIGFYFFPEQEWFRAVGRLCVPIWFFLIGYANTREVQIKLVWGAFLLIFVNIIVGQPLLALNVLFSMLIIRKCIDPIMAYCCKEKVNLLEVAILCFVIVMPTNLFFEYGAQGFLMAIYGYLVRNKSEFGGNKTVLAFMLFSFCTFVFYQQLGFHFSLYPFLFMVIGTLLVRMYLLDFSNVSYPRLTKSLPSPVCSFFQFCGRRTLEIYVVHLVIFKFFALYLGMEGYSLFHFKLIS